MTTEKTIDRVYPSDGTFDAKVRLTCLPTPEGITGERMWAMIPDEFLSRYNDDSDFESTSIAVLANNSIIYESLSMYTPIVIRCNGPRVPEILSWEVEETYDDSL